MKNRLVHYILNKLYPVRINQDQKKGIYTCKVYVSKFNIMSFTSTDPSKSIDDIEAFIVRSTIKASEYGLRKYKADYKFIMPALIRSFLVSFS